jgi:hypothetical protein
MLRCCAREGWVATSVDFGVLNAIPHAVPGRRRIYKNRSNRAILRDLNLEKLIKGFKEEGDPEGQRNPLSK